MDTTQLVDHTIALAPPGASIGYQPWTARNHMQASDGALCALNKFAIPWLFLLIHGHQARLNAMRHPPTQFWRLIVIDSEGTLECRANVKKDPTLTQPLPYVNFPDGILNLVVGNGAYIMLPQENV